MPTLYSHVRIELETDSVSAHSGRINYGGIIRFCHHIKELEVHYEHFALSGQSIRRLLCLVPRDQLLRFRVYAKRRGDLGSLQALLKQQTKLQNLEIDDAFEIQKLLSTHSAKEVQTCLA